MLVQLSINNFVLIHNITIDLSNQFNAFTGETGAGKSLFVDALNFVSGGRSSASIIGKSSDSASVEAVFELSVSSLAYNFLMEHSLIEEGDNLVVLNRVMNDNGRSVSRINNRIVNLSTVRECVSYILDIHSQHETQYLLNERNHIKLLDDYLGHNEVLVSYQSIYRAYTLKLKEIEDFKEKQFNLDQLEFSKFLLADINKVKPSIEDYSDIKSRLKVLDNFEKHKAKLENMDKVLVGSDNVVGKLYDLLDDVSMYPELEQDFKDAYFQLEDISQQVSSLNRDLVFDDREFNELNQRLVSYNQLIRKYGSIECVMEKKQDLETQINQVDHFAELLEDLQNDSKQLYKQLEESALVLSKVRKEAAERLEMGILHELNDLMLENTQFKIVFTPVSFNLLGNEEVTFYISLNKGMDLAPLAKVASGGELSRVMLGLKVIFSRIQGISTLVFDEIDAGVSGKVAKRIGEKMRELSRDAQVISITHLPTVAAFSHHQYLISKEDVENDTITSVSLLDSKARIENLALMIAGNTDADTIKAAENLLKEGQG